MLLTCRGCGATVDALSRGDGQSPWACPHRAEGDVDHVLVLPPAPPADARTLGETRGQVTPNPQGSEVNPFVRYRDRLGSYAAAREIGWSDEKFVEVVGSLDAAVASVWGSGFTITPVTSEPALGAAVGVDSLVIKDETGNVSGSHKARHLFGLALWMAVRGDDPSTRLAIASCGNAAMAAAVIAAAIRRPLDVFVPTWADESVVTRLRALDAHVIRCERRDGESGDPCVLRMREAVAAGALPFGCQGPDNGLTIDGGRTIGWELAEQVPGLAAVFVQVGGGALGTGVARGLLEAGVEASVVAVQAEGCAPFHRAWRRAEEVGLREAVHHRDLAMRPWPSEPKSSATGILDDEAYDWAGLIESMPERRGWSVVATESSIVRAHQLAREHTSIDVDPTGAAGLAGVLHEADWLRADHGPGPGRPVAVLFTGVTRR